MDDLERRRRRLRRARDLIRVQLALAFAVPVLAGFWFVAAPGYIEPMFSRPSLVESVLPWACVGLYLVGITWMVRLSRANPEAGERTWRYRDF